MDTIENCRQQVGSQNALFVVLQGGVGHRCARSVCSELLGNVKRKATRDPSGLLPDPDSGEDVSFGTCIVIRAIPPSSFPGGFRLNGGGL